MPPVGAAERQREPGHDRQAERGQGGDAEHVDPGRDVGRLPVRQQLARREQPQRGPPQPGSPHAGVGVVRSGQDFGAGRAGVRGAGQGPVPGSAGWPACRCGNGTSRARPKMTTITPITTRLATEMSKIDQLR